MAPHIQYQMKSPLLGEIQLSRIGNTPLIRLERVGSEYPGVQILGKAEWHNPGGSVKDRAAVSIIAQAEREGHLRPGKILLDSTSGNTGIAYSMICAIKDIPVTLCMPSNVSLERKRMVKAYGATVIWTDPGEGSDGAIRKARELLAAHPEKYFYADQYSNDANWQAHYSGTANEIWEQTQGRVTHFVATMGTSGTFMGTSRRLKELNPATQCISLQPDSPFHGLEGLKHMASAIIPKIYDATLADADFGISTEAAHRMVRRLAREEGLLVGISSGAAVVGCLQVASQFAHHRRSTTEQAIIVTVLCDGADRYLSERFWDE